MSDKLVAVCSKISKFYAQLAKDIADGVDIEVDAPVANGRTKKAAKDKRPSLAKTWDVEEIEAFAEVFKESPHDFEALQAAVPKRAKRDVLVHQKKYLMSMGIGEEGEDEEDKSAESSEEEAPKKKRSRENEKESKKAKKKVKKSDSSDSSE